jgi:hypothetical protein
VNVNNAGGSCVSLCVAFTLPRRGVRRGAVEESGGAFDNQIDIQEELHSIHLGDLIRVEPIRG